MDTWVINADTVGATQYTNYDFNSYVSWNGHYYGLKQDGLYELEGVTDGGEDIPVNLLTGDLYFDTRQVKAVSRAYLFLAADELTTLKTITAYQGHRYETWYRIEAREAREDNYVRRIHLGRGSRGVTWAFELESVEGSEFDLRFIELTVLPLIRRI